MRDASERLDTIEALTPSNPVPVVPPRRCDWLISAATLRDPGRIFCDAPALPGRLRCSRHAGGAYPLRNARVFNPLPRAFWAARENATERASRLFGDDATWVRH